MRSLLRIQAAVLAGLILAGGLCVLEPEAAEARPAYNGLFKKEYPKVIKNARLKGTKCCTVCHYGKSKKNRNDYGSALKKLVGKKNEKSKVKIAEALEKAEKEKSAQGGKTFGDLLKDGKLPGKEPKKKPKKKD